MEPTRKGPAIERFITSITGKNRVVTIEAGLCMLCDGEAKHFTDALSAHEYAISGMCQRCQDEVFK